MKDGEEALEQSDHDLLIRMDATLTEMKKTLEGLPPKVEGLQKAATENATNITNLRSDVSTLEAKSNRNDTVLGIVSGLAALGAAIVGIFKI